MQLNKLAYRIPEFSAATGLGRTKIYGEISLGRLQVVKVGGATLITAPAAAAYFQMLTAEASCHRASAAGSEPEAPRRRGRPRRAA